LNSTINITFSVYSVFYDNLIGLPWYQTFEEWDNRHIKFLDLRKGISRHPVAFVKRDNFSFAVKETTEKSAKFEIETYHKLLSMGIHTLIPAGFVVLKREPIKIETPTGISYENNDLAFCITVIEDKTIPQSLLFRINFNDANRKLIWNAIAELFAMLHFNNIYWGDASLANILVKFIKVKDDTGRTSTELKAFLADAETVRILPKISKRLCEDDINFFFESLEWIHADVSKSGLIRDNINIDEDKKYFEKKYNNILNVFNSIKVFENKTGIDVKKYFFKITDPVILDEIIKQIEEHKWYLSEKLNKEISFKRASASWLKNIYKPIIQEFEKLKIYQYFPNKNSVSLYIDIMTHKYYLSIEKEKDIGIKNSILSYCKKYAEEEKSFMNLIVKLISEVVKIFPKGR